MTAWDSVSFARNLASALSGLLSASADAGTLFRAAALCAEEAEKICAGRTAACMAGCPHCCVLNVAALLPEAAAIASWLESLLSADEVEALLQRLASHNSWTRWMDDDERIARKAFCPFLDKDGRCAVHPVRPLACRGVTSMDSARCREEFSPIISDEERSVPSDLLRRNAFDEAFALFGRTLKQHGIDDRSIELGTGVRAFLLEPGLRDDLVSGRQLPRDLWN